MTATLERSNGTMAAISPTSENNDTKAISPFASESNFVAAQRMAKALGLASMVPQQYQGEKNLPNVMIALELAARIGASPLMVMQNLYVVHGKPSWSSSFLIACVNQSKRFTPLRFRFEGKPGSDDWGCRAIAKDKDAEEECVGSLITIKLAKAEGWYGKSGSKWQTMPEQMLMYRAAGFWARVYAPELSLGMLTREEAEDIAPPIDVTPQPMTLEPGRQKIGRKPEPAKVVPVDQAPDAETQEEQPEAKEPTPEELAALDAANDLAERLGNAIEESTTLAGLQKLGGELNAAKGTLGEDLYGRLMKAWQAEYKALGGK